MKNNKQYLKYKSQFKTQCILGLVGGACILIGVILIIFTKFLQIKVDGTSILDFSLYEEIRASFDSFNSLSYLSILGIYQVMAILCIGAGAIWQIVDFIKKGIGMANLDAYSLEQYDAIKKRTGDGEKRRRNQNFSSTNMLISGMMLEVIYIWMARFLFRNDSIPDNIEDVSYKLALCNGVGSSVFFPILFIAVGIIVMVVRSLSLKKTKMAIIREDYGVDEDDDED